MSELVGMPRAVQSTFVGGVKYLPIRYAVANWHYRLERLLRP